MNKNLKFGFFILLAVLQNFCLCAENSVNELKDFHLSSTGFNCNVGEIAYTFKFGGNFSSTRNIPATISGVGNTEAWDDNGNAVEALLPESSITLLNGWKVFITEQTTQKNIKFEIKKSAAPASFKNAIPVEVVKYQGYLKFTVGQCTFLINCNDNPDNFWFSQYSYDMESFVNIVPGSIYVFNYNNIDYWVLLNNERNVTVLQAHQDLSLASYGVGLSPEMKFGLGISLVIGFIVAFIFVSRVKKDTGRNSPIKIGDRKKKNPLNRKDSKPNKKSNLAKRPRPPR